MTLTEVITEHRSPTMRKVAMGAIETYGPDARITFASGRPSKRKGSNCYKEAERAGFAHYVLYCGARAGRNRSAGYNILIVESAA